jgi:hypothetical protein
MTIKSMLTTALLTAASIAYVVVETAPRLRL